VSSRRRARKKMLVLVETAAGYGLFKVAKTSLIKADPDQIWKDFETPEKAQAAVSLEAFSKFKDTKDALAEASALIESTLGKGLKKFIKKNILKENITDQLAVCDKQLGAAIKQKFDIPVVYTPNTQELIRGIRTQIHELVSGLAVKDTNTMALSLSHTLNRFKLKFSPEKVDTMIIQAVGLLDDLDRELNNLAMRLKEWYGWHFPELTKIVTDNLTYAKVVRHIGFRHETKSVELQDILPKEIEEEVRQAAEISMGTEITDDDLENIRELADRVVELVECRAHLAEYLKHRMMAIAPNLTHMIGELIGARLISHAGSLLSLAKHPASTVQILGAEKALFRALKTQKQTPKYGLIYHATLVGQSAPKLKGKVSRVLAAKLSLCTRVDALGEQLEPTVALDARRYVEKKLEEFTEGNIQSISKSHSKSPLPRYEPKRQLTKSGSSNYNTATDDVRPEETGTPKKRKGGQGDQDTPSKRPHT